MDVVKAEDAVAVGAAMTPVAGAVEEFGPHATTPTL
jgi:hypothetical protein